MSKGIIMGLLLWFAAACGPDATQQALDRYELANRYHDASMQTAALHDLIRLQPDKNAWLDSLCRIYYEQKHYESAFLAGKDYLATDTTNNAILEIMGYSGKYANSPKVAEAYFHLLYKRTGQITYLYEYAIGALNLGKTDKALDLLNQALQHQSLNTAKVTDNNQQVPIKAAVLNITAVAWMVKGDFPRAYQLLNRALAIYPEFKSAQANRQQVKERVAARRAATELMESS